MSAKGSKYSAATATRQHRTVGTVLPELSVLQVKLKVGSLCKIYQFLKVGSNS